MSPCLAEFGEVDGSGVAPGPFWEVDGLVLAGCAQCGSSSATSIRGEALDVVTSTSLVDDLDDGAHMVLLKREVSMERDRVDHEKSEDSFKKVV